LRKIAERIKEQQEVGAGNRGPEMAQDGIDAMEQVADSRSRWNTHAG
jgi:hypothetical protein